MFCFLLPCHQHLYFIQYFHLWQLRHQRQQLFLLIKNELCRDRCADELFWTLAVVKQCFQLNMWVEVELCGSCGVGPLPDKFYRRLYFFRKANKYACPSIISNPVGKTQSQRQSSWLCQSFLHIGRFQKAPNGLFFYYLNMSKKQHASKQNPKNKLPTLDEQNQPILRVIHKKIRNINKRLTEIAELEHKENLKPEQFEKVQRKQHLLQEKQKLQDNITFLKQAYSENVELFRNHQLKQLELLARSLAVFMTQPHFPEHSKLVKLWSGLQTIQGSNLNESITYIANVLKQSSNDYKLQQALSSFVAQHGEKYVEKKVPTIFTHTDEIIIVKENVMNEKGGVDEIEIVEKIHDGKVQEVTIIVNDQIKPEDTQSPPPTPVSTEPQKQTTNPQTQENNNTETTKQPGNAPQTSEQRPSQSHKNNRPIYKGELRERKEYKGEKRGDGRRRNAGERVGEKKLYRPKQQSEQNKTTEQQQRSAPKSQEEQMRNFKKEQIKQLENEGFIVVGKPKPKPQQQRKKNYRNEPRAQN